MSPNPDLEKSSKDSPKKGGLGGLSTPRQAPIRAGDRKSYLLKPPRRTKDLRCRPYFPDLDISEKAGTFTMQFWLQNWSNKASKLLSSPIFAPTLSYLISMEEPTTKKRNDRTK